MVAASIGLFAFAAGLVFGYYRGFRVGYDAGRDIHEALAGLAPGERPEDFPIAGPAITPEDLPAILRRQAQ